VTERDRTFSDLVDAWRDARRYRGAHGDLAEHHARRYAAFAAAFGVDLERAPAVVPPAPEWVMTALARFSDDRRAASEERRWAEHIHRLALDIDERAPTVANPFSAFLEAPPAVIGAYHRFNAPIDEHVRALTGELKRTVLELMRALHPEAADRRVTPTELQAHGYHPETPAPDPDDYW
jgi:hypothetical protein